MLSRSHKLDDTIVNTINEGYAIHESASSNCLSSGIDLTVSSHMESLDPQEINENPMLGCESTTMIEGVVNESLHISSDHGGLEVLQQLIDVKVRIGYATDSSTTVDRQYSSLAIQ